MKGAIQTFSNTYQVGFPIPGGTQVFDVPPSLLPSLPPSLQVTTVCFNDTSDQIISGGLDNDKGPMTSVLLAVYYCHLIVGFVDFISLFHTYTHTHTHTYTRTQHALTYTHTYTHIPYCVRVHLCIHSHTCIHYKTHTHSHTHTARSGTFIAVT